ncbi:S-layer homology domain-containing protein, partial [bacterium]|nr:S-layer homology domain-containing protein [bacterium]
MKKISLVMLLTLILLLISIPANAFEDVPHDHWDHYDYIDKLQSEGFIRGYPDNTFQGDQELTRYEMIMVMARIRHRLFYELNSINPLFWEVEVALGHCPDRNSFTDVDKDHWAFMNLDFLGNGDILFGYPGGTFNGNRSVTRNELAVVFDTMFDELRYILADGVWPDPEEMDSTPVRIPDLPDDHWAYDSYQRLIWLGALEGYPDGTVKGDYAMTRFEMAIVIARIWG